MPVIEEMSEGAGGGVQEVEPEEGTLAQPAGVRLVQTQRVVEVSPEEAGSPRQFFNRAINATFFSFLGLMGLGSLAMFWPKITGGFGSDVDAGAVTDLSVAGGQPRRLGGSGLRARGPGLRRPGTRPASPISSTVSRSRPVA
jgi:hypothetical protein